MLKTRSLVEAEEAQRRGMLVVRIARISRDENEYTLIDDVSQMVPQDIHTVPIAATPHDVTSPAQINLPPPVASGTIASSTDDTVVDDVLDKQVVASLFADTTPRRRSRKPKGA